MKTQHVVRTLLRSSLIVALSGAAVIGMANPGEAAGAPTGLYGGGATLFSEMARQLFDCYQGQLLAGDTFAFSPNNLVKPGQIPKSCVAAGHAVPVEGLYAEVGSGSGMSAYFTDNPLELVQSAQPNGAVLFFPMPTAQPPAIDNANPALSSYPYPQLDFATSDAPLPNPLAKIVPNAAAFNPAPPWAPPMIAGVNAPVGANFNAAYNPANFGNAIQIPLAEIPVSIILNPGTAPNTALTIQTGLGAGGAPRNVAGGAIALTTAQLCAIFSGLVFDWSDVTTSVPYIDKLGRQINANSPINPKFFTPNFFTNIGPAAVAYTKVATNIVVVYRSDFNGATFILTNYLQSACPQLDGPGNNAGIYHSIFGTPGAAGNTLPSRHFSDLIASVQAYWKANGRTFDVTNNWIGQTGGQGVAAMVGDITSQPKHGGYIGYVSVDFSSPYATIADPPWSASLQNESQRMAGLYFPASSGAAMFIAPSSKSVDSAFANLTVPAANAPFAQWDLYGITYGPGMVHGGVNYTGISELGLPNAAGSYPIAGTAFMYVYSCYNNPGRANTIANFLAWYLGGSVLLPAYTPARNNRANPGRDVAVGQMLSNNGFHSLHALLAKNLLTEFQLTFPDP